MGILSFLNKKQNQYIEDVEDIGDLEDFENLDEAPQVPQVKKKTKAELPDLRREMSVEILGEDGQVMFSGVITECSRREITIGRRPGGLSFKPCEIGSGVVIQGRDSKMAQFYLRAVVAESSRIHIRLKDLVQEVRDDLRDTFRLAVNTPITIFYYDDEYGQLPMDCTLVDISTGGCCISSEQFYEDGQVLRIRIKLENYAPMDLVGEVIRVTERGPTDYSYGILFAQLDKREQDILTRTLLNMQVGDRVEHSRVNGHW